MIYLLVPFPAERTTLTHWDRDKIAAISQTTFWNVFPLMKMYKFR